jgi:hypothetical protein
MDDLVEQAKAYLSERGKKGNKGKKSPGAEVTGRGEAVPPGHPPAGHWIAWDSPLFGECVGQVALEQEGDWLCVRTHSVTGNLALVRKDWITREWTQP